MPKARANRLKGAETVILIGRLLCFENTSQNARNKRLQTPLAIGRVRRGKLDTRRGMFRALVRSLGTNALTKVVNPLNSWYPDECLGKIKCEMRLMRRVIIPHIAAVYLAFSLDKKTKIGLPFYDPV